MKDLQDAWQSTWRRLGLEAPQDDLLARWAEPHRKYHTLQHLRECLALFEAHRHLALHPAEVEIGLWFHDAIYDVKGPDNEQRSADWAKAAVRSGGAPESVAERICSLVMVTRHTGVPVNPDERLLVDIDLAILGASDERFAEYNRQIRAEYAFVPEALFKSKRSSILSSFLDRERIFGTSHFYAELESRARKNLAAAIARNVA